MPVLDFVSNFWNYCPCLFGLTAPSTPGLALFNISFHSHGDSGAVGAWMCMSLILIPSRASLGCLEGLLPLGILLPRCQDRRCYQAGVPPVLGSAATGHCAHAREHILLQFPSPSRLLMALKGGSASREAFPGFFLSLCPLACSSSPNPKAPSVAPGGGGGSG